jgi:hypothetical protein
MRKRIAVGATLALACATTVGSLAPATPASAATPGSACTINVEFPTAVQLSGNGGLDWDVLRA